MHDLKINILLFFLLIPYFSLAQNLQIIVAPNGADVNDGSLSAPLRSIPQAQAQVRDILINKKAQNITVFLRAGIYNLDSTLVFDERDANAEVKVTWQAYPNEKVIITAYSDVKDWQVSENQIDAPLNTKLWQAENPQNPFPCFLIGADNQLIHLSKSRGFVPTIPSNQNPGGLNILHFPEGVLRDFSNKSDIILAVSLGYMYNNLQGFEEIDLKQKKAILKQKASKNITRPYDYYRTDLSQTCFILNDIAHIKPRTFCYNSLINKIFLYPSKNSDPALASYKTPKLSEFIRVSSQNLSFKNLIFQWGNGYFWQTADKASFHDWSLIDSPDAMLRFKNAQNCEVNNCTFKDGGGTGIRLDGFAQNIKILHNTFENLGGGAIALAETELGLSNRTIQNEIANNSIRDIAWLHKASPAIHLWQASQNHIHHNEIKNVPANGIAITGARPMHFNPNYTKRREIGLSINRDEVLNVTSWENSLPFLQAKENIIEYNLIENAVTELNDLNAIYISGTGQGNIIRFNYIKNCLSPGFWGAIRTDDFQLPVEISSNIIRNCIFRGITLKHSGHLVKNNWIIDLKEGKRFDQSLIPIEGYLCFLRPSYENTQVRQNIFYHLGTNKVNFIKGDGKYTQWVKEVKTEKNLYYSITNEALTNLQKNQTIGLDPQSLVANPQFRNLAKEDYQLSSQSMALKLGIQKIDVKKIGIQKQY
jgi:hypothetical protein